MQGTLIQSSSVLLQFVAAALALRLARITERRWAWSVIAAAVALMAVRRGITLARILMNQQSPPADLLGQLLALSVSVLMVAGLSAIRPLSQAIKRMEKVRRRSRRRSHNSVESMDTAVRDAESGPARKTPAVGTLSARAAHDFNNLLTAMCGYVELAKRHAVNAEATAALEQAERAARQAIGVTRGPVKVRDDERSCQELRAAREVQLETVRPCGNGEWVIVAEDDPQVRAITASALTSAGFEVLQAGDGAETMRLLRAHRDRVRLIVLDVDMPRKNGPACLADIRALRAELPIIVFTDNADFDLGGQFTERVVLIRKPFRMSHLNELARRALGGVSAGKAG